MKKKVTSIVFLLLLSVLILANGKEVDAASTEKITDLQQTDINIIDNGKSTINVTFTEVTDATGYHTYYSKDKSTYKLVDSSLKYYDGDKVLIGIYNLSAGSTYYVKVAPVFKTSDGTSEEGTFSSVLEVVTAPAKVDNLKQTKATKSSVTLTWTAADGASGYYVKNENWKTLETVSKTTAKISADTGSSKDYYIYAYKKSSSGYIAESPNYKKVTAYASPKKPINVAKISREYLTWMPTKSNKVTVKWEQGDDDYSVSGYQVEIYNVKGKTKLKTYNITKDKSKVSFNLKKVKNKGFQIRVRDYIKVNGNKYYSSWTSKKAIIPQAKIKLKKVGNSSIKVSWSKVSNATSYTVYVCKNASASKEKWKKVAKVGKNKTSYTIRNLNGWANKGVYVIPTVKVGGKKYKASHTWALYTYYY